ncbi:MAG: hypothetical protein QOI29_1305 [Mycobacterium sp.]|nr:hypothetical protein [Mycobacterium sp.]
MKTKHPEIMRYRDQQGARDQTRSAGPSPSGCSPTPQTGGLVPGVYVFRMLCGLVQFAHLPTLNLLTSLTSDGATAVLVITGMATGLAVPTHAYSVLSATADKRRNQVDSGCSAAGETDGLVSQRKLLGTNRS